MWKIGIHNGYWNGTGFDRLGDALRASAESGVDVYEMNTGVFFQLDRNERLAIRNRAEALGLSLSVNGGFNPANDISADDPAVRKKGIEAARTILEGMRDVGANVWSGINYGAWKRVPDPACAFPCSEKQRIRALSIASLREIMKIAEDNGITLCLEIVNRYEQFLLNTVEEGVSMAQEVGSQNCKVLVDTYHMNIEEDSITDAIRFASAHNMLGEVHASESNRRVPGTGKTHMDWPGIFGALNDVGYDGLITMEPFVVQGIPQSSRICVWRDLSQGLDSQGFILNAQKGAAFIRGFDRGRKASGA